MRASALTTEDVRSRLGLDPFDAYAAAARTRNVERIGGPFAASKDEIAKRATGRTTRLVCEALAWASWGRTALIDADHPQRQDAIVEGARRRGALLGIPPLAILAFYTARSSVVIEPKVFVDHSETERASEIYKDAAPKKPATKQAVQPVVKWAEL